jgi:uncharacterized membrane protein YsdA (DUF1294 family)
VLRVAAAVYAGMSLLAIALYAADKRRAARGQWRISEATLHLVELLGGWPGALVAQRALRHKRWKRSYLIIFWLIVAAHAALWMLIAATGGVTSSRS